VTAKCAQYSNHSWPNCDWRVFRNYPLYICWHTLEDVGHDCHVTGLRCRSAPNHIHYHVIEWLYTGFAWVIGFIIKLFFSLALQPPWALASAFSFMIILQTVGLLGRVISSSQGLYLNIAQHKHRINTYTHQTSMSWVGFELTIPASERAKTVHALDRSATVTGIKHLPIINTYKYSATANSHTLQFTTALTKSSESAAS
jgi:hypothetical protein